MNAYEVPVGRDTECFSAANVIGVLMPPKSRAVPDVAAEIRRALENPIKTDRLCTLAQGKHTAAIVVNDITRPYPGRQMVEGLLEELHKAGVEDAGISLIMAYGHHRDNTEDELRQMLGNELMERLTVVHHHAEDPDTLKTLGMTSMGIPVEVNARFAEADVKITTGCITPHQLAGFSGGRKSILPGISGMNALKQHHSFPIRPEETSLGWLEGNPFHHQAVQAARIAGVDFIVNSVDNAKREMIRCVAGDLEAAHAEGVTICRQVWGAKMPEKADIVVVSPGGYPRDFDLHQSQKALGCAEMLCKPGGTIILCARMQDGAGRPGAVLENAANPQEVVQAFRQTGYTPQALSKAYMIARAMERFHIFVASCAVPKETLRNMFFEPFDTVQGAVDAAVEEAGPNATILVVPYASDTLPLK
ncbi:MAG: nickel-dependent lactate racemase [Firmicutes bacterium]|nr:nickel-dependent lactate racemase [Bacillota bacterium]